MGVLIGTIMFLGLSFLAALSIGAFIRVGSGPDDEEDSRDGRTS